MPYRHSVSVAGAVYDQATDKFLVIQRMDTGAWQLPGGILEEAESIHDGVVREVLEETGVSVRPIRLSGVYKNMEIGVVALVFLCEAKSGEPVATDEARDVRWLPRETIRETMPPAFACRLLDALEDVPAIRSNDGVNLV
jgi:8-oxo-dGTP diphosphatase